jgi:hypothetical protein
MYWKMSIDLTLPLVPSMGQHDPLDGLVTYEELQLDAPGSSGQLEQERADLIGICGGMHMVTSDPLGIGGLLSDASGIIRMTKRGVPLYPGLLETIFDSALVGLESFARSGSLQVPAGRRLAFRELGLSIGLSGVEQLPDMLRGNPVLADRTGSFQQQVQALMEYVPLKEQIEQFWLDSKNREVQTWTEHRDINTVMLATSLVPDGFLEI